MAHELVHIQAEINQMRRAYGRCAVTSHKQIGLRRLRDAEAFLGKNKEYALRLLETARFHLPYAQTWSF